MDSLFPSSCSRNKMLHRKKSILSTYNSTVSLTFCWTENVWHCQSFVSLSSSSQKKYKDVKLLNFKLLRVDFHIISSEFSLCPFSSLVYFFPFPFCVSLLLLYAEVQSLWKNAWLSTRLSANSCLLWKLAHPFLRVAGRASGNSDLKSFKFSEIVWYVFLLGSNPKH